MAIVRVASVSRTGPGTTSSINTTGSNLIVIFTAEYSAPVQAPTDSNSNTWTPLTEYNGVERIRGYYVLSPTVGSGHTFTNNNATNSLFAVAAYSGVASFDQESGSGTNVPGSITPSADNALLLTGLACGLGATHTIDSGFTVFEDTASVGALGELIQTSAAAANPTWTNPGGDLATAMASFLALSSGDGGGVAFEVGEVIYY